MGYGEMVVSLGTVIGLVNVGSMIVSALVLAVMATRVRRSEHRILFGLLILFTVSHAAYHLAMGAGLTEWVRLLSPLSIWILVIFGIYYLKREVRIGG